jgi:hypothetical protein
MFSTERVTARIRRRQLLRINNHKVANARHRELRRHRCTHRTGTDENYLCTPQLVLFRVAISTVHPGGVSACDFGTRNL